MGKTLITKCQTCLEAEVELGNINSNFHWEYDASTSKNRKAMCLDCYTFISQVFEEFPDITLKLNRNYGKQMVKMGLDLARVAKKTNNDRLQEGYAFIKKGRQIMGGQHGK